MRIRFASLAAVALAASFVQAQDVKVETYRLPNGLRVILAPDHSLPMATINTWFNVGSKDEADRRSGFAHLFEHLMFMGTTRVPGGQFDKIMEGAGGENNASTAEDRTNFYSSGPANLLPTLLWLDADRLEGLSQAMTKEKVDLQRSVVQNERRQNTENTPYGKAYETINSLMFPAGHPYHTSVIGSHEDLEAASVSDVTGFFDTYYVPNNASLVVAGDFDPKTIKPLIAKLYGTLARKNDPPRRTVAPLAPLGVKKVTMVDQVQFPKIVDVYRSPAAYKPGDIEMRLAGDVLASGLTSRLYNRLVVQDQVASEVSAFQESRLLGSLFYVDVTASPNVSLDKVQNVIDTEVAKFLKTGPTKAELDRIKAQAEFGLLNGLQSIGDRADKLNEYAFYMNDPNSFKKVLAMYRDATPESVRKVAAKVMQTSNRLELRVIPQVEAPKVNPRDTQPTIPTAKTFAPQAPTLFTLKNGIKVYYWNRPELPLMSVATDFRAGADIDPISKAGRVDMTASMLDEGAGTRSAEQFQDSLDQLGASFSASASHRDSTTSLNVISANFGPALNLYADALIRPHLAETDWQRIKRTTVSDLQQALDDPSTVARMVAMREYFGITNISGVPVSGTVNSVSGLGVSDIKAAYKTVFQPQNATFFVAGSLSKTEVQKALEASFGAWRTAATMVPTVNYPAVKSDGLRLLIVDKPGAVQTVIRFVLPGITYDDPNRLTYEALGTILGGSFTSRLNQNLREAKGYTYGAGSSFAFDKSFGYFVANAAVRADVTGASLDEFFKELKAIQSGNVSAEEAGKAASIERAGVVSSMGTLNSLLGTAIDLHEHGRPFSDLSLELAKLSTIDAAKINAVAGRAIDLNRGVLVMVGDKATILKQIEGKGLPTPEIVKP